MYTKNLLGKIFLSHSYKDREFALKLLKSLESEGYSLWLDEKQLIVGDYLPRALGTAIQKSKVTIVILSENSANSNWVGYEISQALNLMIKGDMRLIPVLIAETKLPPELTSLVFADFRRSYEFGLSKVKDALEAEISKYNSLIPLIPEEYLAFERKVEINLEAVFGKSGSGGLSSEYKSINYKYVMLDGEEIWYIIESSFGFSRPLSNQWWNEFSSVMADWGVRFVILITDRPIDTDNWEPRPSAEGERIFSQSVLTPYINPTNHLQISTNVIIVDLSGLNDEVQYRELIHNARLTMQEIIQQI